jgi:hypothetical protein
LEISNIQVSEFLNPIRMRGAKKYLGYGPLIAALNAASAASREVEGSGGRLGAMIDGKNRTTPRCVN